MKLIFYKLLILNIVLVGVFIVGMDVMARTCQDKCPETFPIELQIGIPGATHDCTYTYSVYNLDKHTLEQNKTGTRHCVAGFPQYIRGIYNLFIGVVGLLAVVMIMLGGFKWLLAAGNAQKIAGAKTTIISAIMGLVLALGSYSILSWINPALTELKLQPASITLKDNKNVIGICKKSQKLIPDLDEGEVPECGNLYMLLEQTEPKKEDQFCMGLGVSKDICYMTKDDPESVQKVSELTFKDNVGFGFGTNTWSIDYSNTNMKGCGFLYVQSKFLSFPLKWNYYLGNLCGKDEHCTISVDESNELRINWFMTANEATSGWKAAASKLILVGQLMNKCKEYE